MAVEPARTGKQRTRQEAQPPLDPERSHLKEMLVEVSVLLVIRLRVAVEREE